MRRGVEAASSHEIGQSESDTLKRHNEFQEMLTSHHLTSGACGARVAESGARSERMTNYITRKIMNRRRISNATSRRL